MSKGCARAIERFIHAFKMASHRFFPHHNKSITATACVDSSTDRKIQNTIRKNFADCTILTVAHRLVSTSKCVRASYLSRDSVCLVCAQLVITLRLVLSQNSAADARKNILSFEK